MPWLDSQPLRLGAPDNPAVEPLLYDLDNNPGVILERLPAPTLLERFREEQYDCALLPPLDVFSFPLSRVVPGIGVTAALPKSQQTLYSHLPESQIGGIDVLTGAEFLTGMTDLLFLLRGHPSPPRTSYRETGRTNGESVLASGPCAPALSENYPFQYDLGTWWHDMTSMPLVLWMWACRFRAPYPRLRRVLAAARQAGMARLEQLSEALSAKTLIPFSSSHQYYAETLRFSLGSLEIESVRLLRDKAFEVGRCAADSDIRFC